MSGPMRGSRPNLPSDAGKVGLPPRPFLYTLDQISMLIDVQQVTLERTYVHFEGRSVGAAPRSKMLARNIAPPDDKPDWRVAEREMVRWFKNRGFRYYDRGAVTH